MKKLMYFMFVFQLVGVVPAKKTNYFLTLVTSFLSARPGNSIAIIVHANRAGDGGKKQNMFHTQFILFYL